MVICAPPCGCFESFQTESRCQFSTNLQHLPCGNQTQTHIISCQHCVCKQHHYFLKVSGKSAYLGNIDVVRVMFSRCDHECDSLIKLDTSKRRDAHVQKYPKQHSQRNMTQHICHHYRQACTEVRIDRIRQVFIPNLIEQYSLKKKNINVNQKT